MKRYNHDKTDEVFDLVIVGGGIYGAAMAYTAALNGLKILVLEKDDFCSHASANSQKVIHGGLRYLQSFNIKRVIESIREKQRFYHLFSHIVQPLPCLLPTSGFGTKGNEAFRIAFLIYAFLQKIICRGALRKNLDYKPSILSASETRDFFPHLTENNIRGSGLWYDGICTEPERAIIALMQGAEKLGARVASYTEVRNIERQNESTVLVDCVDKLSRSAYRVKTEKAALCTGTWFKVPLCGTDIPKALSGLGIIRGMNVLFPAIFKSKISYASKVQKENESRFLFIVPWKSSELGVETSLDTMLNEADAPVDREVFMRQLEFYRIRTAK